LRTAILSNFSPKMLEAALAASGVAGTFDAVISTDEARCYKPEARAYALGVDRLKLPRERIGFAAFAGWDVAGAKWFGYPTFWVNRLGSPSERLGEKPDGAGLMTELVRFVCG
jgi:2-haloacid dehalogenase